MDAGHLRVFEAVAAAGGMNRAAAALNTVQSNVTARIRQLEAELGRDLFRRHSRGVELTEAGRRLLPFAARTRQLLQDARRAVADDGGPQGRLTIGALETTTALRLSPLLAGYAAEHPAVDLVLRTGTTAELIAQVQAGELEGAFVAGPIDHPELETATVVQEELVVATAPTVPRIEDLCTRGEVKIVVLRAGCSYRQRLEEILARRGVTGLRRLEFGTIDSIIGCVAAGLGVTLLPRSFLESLGQSGRIALHDLPTEEAAVETLFIRRRDAYQSSALGAFVNLAVQSHAAEPLGRVGT